MQRRGSIVGWLIIALALISLLLVWQYQAYRSNVRVLPEGMEMAGVAVGGMTLPEALNVLEVAYSEPIELTYQNEQLLLSPDTVELRFNLEETEEKLNEALSARQGVEGFINYLFRQSPEPVDVAPVVTYSEERLDGFLTRIARQYDQPPQAPVPLPASLTFRAGQPGYELNVEASRARLVPALLSAADHDVELIVETAEAPEPDLSILGDMVDSLLNDHPNIIGGVFIKDLQTGDELARNAEVAYSGLSVLKVAILEETYRALDPPLTPEVQDLISDTLGVTSSNFKANLLLGDVIGSGDPYTGVETLRASMTRLGLVNTFMATPYDEEAPPPTIVTPANSRTDVNIQPDPYMQTTPVDMGLLLEMIYQCSEGGGALMAVYPEAFSPEECTDMVTWMTRNSFENLIEAGLPEGTRVAQKHGFGDGGPHADAGIVFSPGGDFVIVIYLDSPQYLEWAESQPLVADIATATYNYFNPSP